MERAVDYTRVSTEEEVQINALENQIIEAREAIIANGWVHVGSYIDEGKTGTTIKSRKAYKQLLDDLATDRFDIIVIKSQDRLMRNTKDWYLFVDSLVKNNKRLYFYLERKFYTPDDALITGIRAILAEEFSRELSKKINNAHSNRQKKGSNVLITSNTWGYDKIGKEVVINEKEADIVRKIYALCIQGYGSRTIAKTLYNEGIRSRTGGDFPEGTIRRIIRNPLFKGTVIMNKRHLDFNTKRTSYLPEKEWIIHENIVPAIVSKEVWEEANQIMDKRVEIENTEDFRVKKRGCNIGKFDLSSKIICGECGNVYWRRYRRNAKKEQIIEWSCSEYIKRGRKNKKAVQGQKKVKAQSKGGCDNIHIKEKDLSEVLYDVAKEIYVYRKEEIIANAMNILNEVLGDDNDLESLELDKERIMQKRELLLDKHLDGEVPIELFKRKDEVLKAEYNRVCIQIENYKINDKNKILKKNRLETLKNEIQNIEDKDLCVHKLMEHIERIEIFYDRLIIFFDIFESIDVKIEKINYQKVKMSVCARN